MAANQYMQPLFDSLSQGVQVAQSLRQAALQKQALDQARQAQLAQQNLQQQEIDQRSRQQGLQEQLDAANLMQSGAQPVDQNGNVQVQAPTSKINPETMDSTGGLSVDFDSTLPASVPSDPNQNVNIGGRQLAIPTIQDQLDRATQLSHVGKVPLTQEGSDAIGGVLPAGTYIDPSHMAGIGSAARAEAINNKADNAQPKYTVKDFTDSNTGHVTRVVSDAQGNEVRCIDLGKIAGEKDTGSGEAAQAAAMTDNQRRQGAEKALSDYQKGVEEEAKLNAENAKLQVALKSKMHYVDDKGVLHSFLKDGITDPDEQKGFQDEMQQRLQANLARLPQVISDKQGAQNRFADLSGNQAARPTQAQPKTKGKLTDRTVAAQYLQKAGGDKAKARQLAVADGWSL